MPTMPSAIAPLVYAVPVQLIAYHTAVALGAPTSISRAILPSLSRWNNAEQARAGASVRIRRHAL